ncbi:hypothetical protein DOTSEDRAFT_68765 [Dothistroma septosporum NZE10]|uniref:Uncharacterized protein n=1 Tax=Dothistroma septosporum (strain NZE10 / CBS 128990) TaxID=675120 RepID=N1Q4Z1_DOTSN|nr:hypothetical protein DOTSEDRAFT_68765 [Dothistroma septosporum NZE10]
MPCTTNNKLHHQQRPSPLARNMPSPRASPAMRPTSPCYKTSSHFDPLQPPTQRPVHSRTKSNQRRAPTESLKLPSLPRFHPANFPSSSQTTPDGTASPQPPVSPRAHQRMYSDAQKQLYFNQREMLSAAARGTSPSQAGKPTSPRLQPLGSPGPVTPLELEAEEGYLLAGARSTSKDTASSAQLVERLIREETRRLRSATQAGQPPSR